MRLQVLLRTMHVQVRMLDRTLASTREIAGRHLNYDAFLYIYMYMYMYVRMCMYMYPCMYVRVCVCICIHIYVYACMRVYVYMHITGHCVKIHAFCTMP